MRSTGKAGKAGKANKAGKAGIVIVVALVSLAGGHGFLATAHEGAETPKTHMVSNGETLWTVAHDYAPSEDPRSYVHRVQRLNRLSSAQVFPGQTLILPSDQ
jgi:LysM repeat protein